MEIVNSVLVAVLQLLSSVLSLLGGVHLPVLRAALAAVLVAAWPVSVASGLASLLLAEEVSLHPPVVTLTDVMTVPTGASPETWISSGLRQITACFSTGLPGSCVWRSTSGVWVQGRSFPLMARRKL